MMTGNITLSLELCHYQRNTREYSKRHHIELSVMKWELHAIEIILQYTHAYSIVWCHYYY